MWANVVLPKPGGPQIKMALCSGGERSLGSFLFSGAKGAVDLPQLLLPYLDVIFLAGGAWVPNTAGSHDLIHRRTSRLVRSGLRRSEK